jgi:hypothetical protein
MGRGKRRIHIGTEYYSSMLYRFIDIDNPTLKVLNHDEWTRHCDGLGAVEFVIEELPVT